MKSYKTYILVIIVILFNTDLFSQGQGNGKRNGQKEAQVDQTEKSGYSPEKMTKIIFYNSDEIIKKIKLKDKSKRYQVSSAIETFNDRMTEIQAFDSGSLTTAKVYWEQKIKEVQQSGNRYIMQEAQVKVREMLAPIRKKITSQNLLLDDALKKALSPKQYNKWVKYQKSKLRPKTPNQNNQPQMQQRRGRGQGQGRRY